MDSFQLERLLRKSGFTEYWHPGNYDKEKVKALGFQHSKYGVIYLKRDPKKPQTPQTSFPLVINGEYEKNIKSLIENTFHFSYNRDQPAFYNTNLRGFPSRINPEYKGKKESPQPTAYGIDLNVESEEGLNSLFAWIENRRVKTDTTSNETNNDSQVHDERVLREIKTRRGQPEFRQTLLSLFGGKCCITGCNIESVLEAAHIISHADGTNYSNSNGLLLRADIHTLFDLNLIGVDERGMVHIHHSLKNSEYECYDNKTIKEKLSSQKKKNLKARFYAFKNKNNVSNLNEF